MTPLLVLLTALDLEALAALAWAFFTPSESGQGVFLWLSTGRLALAIVLLIIFLALLAIATHVRRDGLAAERRLAHLDSALIERRQLAPTLMALAILPVFVAAAALIVTLTPQTYDSYKAWAPETFPLLHSAVSAFAPLLALLVISSLQVAIFLALRHRRILAMPALWAWDRLVPSMLALLIVLATVFHWLVLIFQLRFFVDLPAWYWIFDPIPFIAGDLWFVLGASALLGLACWLLMIQQRLALGLSAVAALGFFLQFSPGLMSRGGLDSLRDRYFTTYHEAYVRAASSSDLSLLDTVRRYEEAYGSGSFTGTKPPGLMVFYSALDHLANGFPSPLDDDTRYQRLSDLVVWLFPVLAVGTAALIFVFARRFLEDPSGLVPRAAPLLYVLAPSVALFTFFADQAVYPAVFLLGAWFTVIAVRRGTLLWAFLLGGVLYVAAFFAFTMLPLYVFAGLYLLLYHWQEASGKPLQRIILAGVAIAAGTLLIHLLALWLLNYDFLPRFERTMSINHNFDFYLRVDRQPPAGPEPPALRLRQILGAAWINNLDFAAAIGFPLYILFLAQAARRVWLMMKSRVFGGDLILLALLLSFVVLNLAGTAQGEVPRLWLFWLPMVAVLAAYELEPHLRRRPHLLLAVGAAQLVTLMLTFHFQDLRM